MKKNMIKAVVFDMGGVIVDLDTDLCLRNFKELAGFDAIEDYLDRFHQKGFIGELEKGSITEDDYYARCLSMSRPGTSKETIRDCFCSLLVKLNPDTVALIKELKGQYDLYILSNNNSITRAKFSRMMEEAGIPGPETFKKEFYSYEMHLLKPGREIYDAVIEGIGARPEEILFIDDSITNVEGAQAAGIKTVWLSPGKDIREEVFKAINDR